MSPRQSQEDIQKLAQDKMDALVMLTENQREKGQEIVREAFDLVLKGAAVDTQDRQHGLTLLMMAAVLGCEDVALDLAGRGADLEARARYIEGDYFDGRTALVMAAGSQSLRMIEILLDAGAKTDAQTEAGLTALMVAAMEGNDEAIALLLDRGADPTIKDNNGKTAGDLYTENCYGLTSCDLEEAQERKERGEWSRFDETTVVRERLSFVKETEIREIFNFASRSVLTTVRDFKADKETSFSQRFDDVARDYIAAAAKELKAMGGKVDEEAPPRPHASGNKRGPRPPASKK